LLDDGRRQSPAIGHGNVTKSKISFTSNKADASITIQLDVSSESGYDFAFISTLDNAGATSSSGYYGGSRISGTQSVTVTIPVPTAGSHFIDIGYQKDNVSSTGSDCAWFKVTSSDSGGPGMPSDPTRSGYTFSGWYTETNGGGSQFTGDTTVSVDITVYAKWISGVSVQIQLQPTQNPSLSNTSLLVNQSAEFSAGSGYSSYQWYWDGATLDGAVAQDYTLEANSKTPGVYELSVVVASGTGLRSARCRVTITSN
jgi:uncharacterized repeat protein (TIGR02543 family)